jgi:hypothetical protein
MSVNTQGSAFKVLEELNRGWEENVFLVQVRQVESAPSQDTALE